MECGVCSVESVVWGYELGYLCCRKPRKGANPVPGPTMIRGAVGSVGAWKVPLGRILTWIYGRRSFESV